MIASICRKMQQTFSTPKAERGLTMIEIAVTSVLVAILLGVSVSKMTAAVPKTNGFAAAVTQGALEKAFSQVSNTLDKAPADFTNGDLNTVLDLVSGSSTGNLVLSVTDQSAKVLSVSVGGTPMASFQLRANGVVNALVINPKIQPYFAIIGPNGGQRVVEKEATPTPPSRSSCGGGGGQFTTRAFCVENWEELPVALGTRFNNVTEAAFNPTSTQAL